ncbi:MAG: winged helix-turn-helix domain-containing protein, partial [Microbacterium sp.]
RVQSAWWEHGRPADAEARVADELRAAARWQSLERISVSGWGDAVEDLAGALPEASRHEAGAPEPVALSSEEPASVEP